MLRKSRSVQHFIFYLKGNHVDRQSRVSKKYNGDEQQKSQSSTDPTIKFDSGKIPFAIVSNHESHIEQNINIEPGKIPFADVSNYKSHIEQNINIDSGKIPFADASNYESHIEQNINIEPEKIPFADVSNYESHIEQNINTESEKIPFPDVSNYELNIEQNINIEPEKKTFADVSNYELNIEQNINIESELDEYDNTDIDNQELIGALSQLLTGSTHKKVLPVAREAETGCPPGEIFVEYIYEHDIYNQVFNSALQYRKSPVLRSLQSDINDWTVEEIYKRNLVADVSDPVRLVHIMDISKEYNNNPAVRYYVSLVIRKTQIPTIRRVFTLIFDKLQREYFSASNSEIDWSSMVSIPIQ
ncbi:unnamed protein product [Rotaria magnacalcarata]|uniref:Uncharacterized protein n=1 Tax=Rotaria magnacalcarata TaxID=392030 RepID=A0A8S2NJ19_9BILA|nr:unnamed protein product [Rotaria magnacalcarata]